MHRQAYIVCGSRTVSDSTFVHSVLDQFSIGTDDLLITGGANGADSIARDYAVSHTDSSPVFYAEWAKYGRSAGPKRNKRMLDALMDLSNEFRKGVIAFVDKPMAESKGTAGMCRMAKDAGISVFVYDTVTRSFVGRW